VTSSKSPRGGARQLPHAEVVDDEQGHGSEIGEVLLPGSIEGGVGDLRDQRVSFAVDDAMDLLDGYTSDRLGEMTLAGAWRAREEDVLTLADETRGGQVRRRGRDSSSC
jgi:hypothetical protein